MSHLYKLVQNMNEEMPKCYQKWYAKPVYTDTISLMDIAELIQRNSTAKKSDAYEKSGHPCRTDFERFGELIGLPSKRISRILDRYMALPELTKTLTLRSFLNDKMKRIYLRIVNERIARFKRQTL